MQDGLAPHCRRVMRAVLEGRVVTLLGAGANLCGRPPGEAWERGRYLPSGAELARHLAARFDYPDADPHDLVRISEYAYVMTGSGPLYDQLHEVFDADYAIGPLHRFLAALPGRLAAGGRRPTSSATWPTASTVAGSCTGCPAPMRSWSSGRMSTARSGRTSVP